MKRNVILFAQFIFSLFAINAQEINIASIYLIDVTEDKNDKWRYAPLKAFDGDERTAFAIPSYKLDYANRMFRIHFDRNYEIDELAVKAGYFDVDYYKKNYRIKKLTLLFNEGKFDSRIKPSAESFILQDEMREQHLKLSSAILCNEIWFCADELYSTNQYADVCIADISFYLQGVEYAIKIRPSPYSMAEYRYDENGNVCAEHLRADHIDYEIIYKTDSDGVREEWTTYVDEEEREITKMIKKAYPLTDGKQQSEWWGFKITDYYDGNRIIKTEVQAGQNLYSAVYAYKGDKLSSSTYGEYFYEDGMLKGFFSYNYYRQEMNIPGSRYFASYYNEYDSMGRIHKKYVMDDAGFTASK